MASSQHYALLLLACLTVFSVIYCHAAEPPLPSKNSSTLQDIKNMCTDMYVKYSHLCFESLKSDPRSFNVFFGLLPNISMDIAMANATAVRSDLLNAVNYAHENAIAKGVLELCIKRFDVAIKSILVALPSYKFPMDPFDSPINGLLTVAEGNVTYCRNMVKKQRMQPALLSNIETVKRLLSVSLDLIRNEEV